MKIIDVYCAAVSDMSDAVKKEIFDDNYLHVLENCHVKKEELSL